jgi:opacity protein-like surface antigen
MKQLLVAIVAVAAFSGSAIAADCAKDYKDFWDQFNSGSAKGLTGDKLAIANRAALRAYDACSAGDDSSASSLFKKLNEAAPAKGDDYWKELSASAPAKK